MMEYDDVREMRGGERNEGGREMRGERNERGGEISAGRRQRCHVL